MEYSKKNYPREYEAWRGMKKRTTQTYRHNFHRYVGKEIYPEWTEPNGFIAFMEHIGPKPSPTHSLDRIDNEKGYIPGNIRWATKKEQTENRFITLIITPGEINIPNTFIIDSQAEFYYEKDGNGKTYPVKAVNAKCLICGDITRMKYKIFKHRVTCPKCKSK